MGHTLSQPWHQVSKPGLSDSEGHVGHHRPPGLPPRMATLGQSPSGFSSQGFPREPGGRHFCASVRVLLLITARSRTVKSLHFPGKRSSVPWGPFCAVGLCLPLPLPQAHPSLRRTLLFPVLLHSNAWLCCLVFF